MKIYRELKDYKLNKNYTKYTHISCLEFWPSLIHTWSENAVSYNVQNSARSFTGEFKDDVILCFVTMNIPICIQVFKW